MENATLDDIAGLVMVLGMFVAFVMGFQAGRTR